MDAPDRRNRLKNVEAVNFHERTQKKMNKWVLFAICVLALIIVAVLAVFGYKHIAQRLQPSDATYTAHVLSTDTANTEDGDVVYAPYKSGIVMASRGEVRCYNTSGKTEWELEVGVLNPFIKINGSYILLAGKNTKDFLLIKDGKILVQANSTYNILNAGVAKNGAFFLVEDEPYYKGLLTVRDSKNKDMFVWHSGSSYIIDATFNDRASQIALTTLTAAPQTENTQQTESSYMSSLLLFKLHENTPYKTYDFDRQIAANVFLASGRYIVVTDSGVQAYSTGSGERVWSYDITPHTLQRTDFEANKLALLTLAENGTQTLHILASDGSLTGKVEGLKNTGDISMASSIIATAGGNTLTVYRTNGARRYEVALPKTYNDICLFNNGQYLLGANNIVFDILSTK